MSNKDPFTNVTLMVVGFFLGFLLCAGARSEGLEGALGVQQSIYTDGSGDELSFGGKLGHSRVPVYLWAGYEAPSVKLLGQPMGDTDIFSVGLGASQEVVEGLSLFVEAGYSSMDLETNPYVIQEVTYSFLVGRHAQGDVKIPVDFCYPSQGTCYDHAYEVDDGFTARVGGEWQVTEHIAVTASYKFSYFDQEMYIRKPSWEEGDGYWREDETLDLSAFEVGLWFTW